MSHYQELAQLKDRCDQSGECAAYELALAREDAQLDQEIASLNQMALSAGLLVGLLGLIILLTPFWQPLKRLQRFVVPKLLLIAPIVIAVVVGGAIGFAVSFSACYKQECSAAENSAIYTVPLIATLVAIPLTVRIFRKRQQLADKVERVRPLFWILLGVLIIALAASTTFGKIRSNNLTSELEKEYFRSNELLEDQLDT